MTINNLPSNIAHIVQPGWLMRFFDDALYPNLLYRHIYKAMEVPQHLGQVYTFQKKGLLPPVRAALTPPANTDNSSGLTPKVNTYEQYSVTLAQYADTVDTNMLSSGIASVDLYKEAAEDLGKQAGQSLDLISRQTMYQAYAGGRTYLTAGATAATTVTVKDISGFNFVYVNGVRQATSVSNPHPVSITESGTPAARNVTGVTPGALNLSSDRIPGTLTLSAAVTSFIGDRVVSNFAPVSIRPNGKSTAFNIAAGDVMTFAVLNAASHTLMSLGVPVHPETGYYHAYLDPFQIQQLVNDNAIQKVYETREDSAVFQRGAVGVVANCLVMNALQAPNEANEAGVTVRRGIVTGDCAGYEVRSSLINDWLKSNNLSATGYVDFSPETYVAMILRTPQDRLQQVVSNSWSFIGNWVAATDIYGGVGGSSAYYRRAVLVETA
jgi:hypothetical protein